MSETVCRRWTCLILVALAGCTGTIASVHVPSLPSPPPSKFESFEDWDKRVNPPATTRSATQSTTTQAPTTQAATTQAATIQASS